MKRKQTIAQALRVPAIRIALNQLVGCPAGGWGETDQAFRAISEALPWRDDRDYTRGELVDHALHLDHADRYQWRFGVSTNENPE